jgi:hypothetical protein
LKSIVHVEEKDKTRGALLITANVKWTKQKNKNQERTWRGELGGENLIRNQKLDSRHREE